MRKKQAFNQSKWRLYADHNVEAEMVAILRQSKLDVVYVNESPALKREREDGRFHAKKASQMRRYLLTRDEDFWNDRMLPLHESPGVILVRVQPPSEAAYAVVALRNLFRLFNRVFAAQHTLTTSKIRLGEEGLTLKFLDQQTGKRQMEQFSWDEIV